MCCLNCIIAIAYAFSGRWYDNMLKPPSASRSLNPHYDGLNRGVGLQRDVGGLVTSSVAGSSGESAIFSPLSFPFNFQFPQLFIFPDLSFPPNLPLPSHPSLLSHPSLPFHPLPSYLSFPSHPSFPPMLLFFKAGSLNDAILSRSFAGFQLNSDKKSSVMHRSIEK